MVAQLSNHAAKLRHPARPSGPSSRPAQGYYSKAAQGKRSAKRLKRTRRKTIATATVIISNIGLARISCLFRSPILGHNQPSCNLRALRMRWRTPVCFSRAREPPANTP